MRASRTEPCMATERLFDTGRQVSTAHPTHAETDVVCADRAPTSRVCARAGWSHARTQTGAIGRRRRRRRFFFFFFYYRNSHHAQQKRRWQPCPTSSASASGLWRLEVLALLRLCVPSPQRRAPRVKISKHAKSGSTRRYTTRHAKRTLPGGRTHAVAR
jgi:hypothetical protein